MFVFVGKQCSTWAFKQWSKFKLEKFYRSRNPETLEFVSQTCISISRAATPYFFWNDVPKWYFSSAVPSAVCWSNKFTCHFLPLEAYPLNTLVGTLPTENLYPKCRVSAKQWPTCVCWGLSRLLTFFFNICSTRWPRCGSDEHAHLSIFLASR